MAEIAGEFLAEGPPFDLEALGLARHEAFLSESEVIFVFEVKHGLATLDEMLADPDFWSVASSWEHVIAGQPRFGSLVFEWPEHDRPEDGASLGGVLLVPRASARTSRAVQVRTGGWRRRSRPLRRRAQLLAKGEPASAVVVAQAGAEVAMAIGIRAALDRRVSDAALTAWITRRDVRGQSYSPDSERIQALWTALTGDNLTRSSWVARLRPRCRQA